MNKQFSQAIKEAYNKGFQAGMAINDSDAVNQVFSMLLGLPCKILKNKFNFTNEQLQKFGELIVLEYQEFNDTVESLEELRDFIYETTGIKFEMEN